MGRAASGGAAASAGPHNSTKSRTHGPASRSHVAVYHKVARYRYKSVATVYVFDPRNDRIDIGIAAPHATHWYPGSITNGPRVKTAKRSRTERRYRRSGVRRRPAYVPVPESTVSIDDDVERSAAARSADGPSQASVRSPVATARSHSEYVSLACSRAAAASGQITT